MTRNYEWTNSYSEYTSYIFVEFDFITKVKILEHKALKHEILDGKYVNDINDVIFPNFETCDKTASYACV